MFFTFISICIPALDFSAYGTGTVPCTHQMNADSEQIASSFHFTLVPEIPRHRVAHSGSVRSGIFCQVCCRYRSGSVFSTTSNRKLTEDIDLIFALKFIKNSVKGKNL
jgi:hypothetical protein